MLDDDLTDRLMLLADDIEDGTVLVAAAAVRAHGDRRRAVTTTAIAGTTTVAVITGVALAASGAPAGQRVDSGGFGAPTASPSSAGSPSPGASSPTTPTSVTSTGGARRQRGGDRTRIPAGLTMLHEGERGWERNGDRSVLSAVNPCGGADVTLPGRTDARTLTGRGHAQEEKHSPSLVTHHLFLYADDTAAARAFDKLSAEAASCGWHNATPAMNPGEADTLLRLRKRDPGAYEQIKDRYWLHDAVVVRDHNALFLAHNDTKGAGMTSNLDDQELGWMLAPLCQAGVLCR